jgi:hypothetical protein
MRSSSLSLTQIEKKQCVFVHRLDEYLVISTGRGIVATPFHKICNLFGKFKQPRESADYFASFYRFLVMLLCQCRLSVASFLLRDTSP